LTHQQPHHDQEIASTSGVHCGRKPGSGKKRAYNVTPESKVAATIKRQTTRAINAGQSEAEAKKIGQAAGKALAEKLGA
jgi:hypothetical protein